MKVAHCHAHQERIRSSDACSLTFSQSHECIRGETMLSRTIIELEVFDLSVSTDENRTIACPGNRHLLSLLDFWCLMQLVCPFYRPFMSVNLWFKHRVLNEQDISSPMEWLFPNEEIFWVCNQLNYFLFYAKHLSMGKSDRASLCNLSTPCKILHDRYW